MFARKRATLLHAALVSAALAAHSAALAQTTVPIAIDAGAKRHPISPLIYGVAHAGPTALADLNCPLNRNGGNNTSRYNWQLNADNRGQDWYFESIGDSSAVAGERGDTFIADSRSGGWAWTGNWRAISSLTAGAWNTFTLTLPTNAATPLYRLGVEFATGGAWTGTCYLDSISW
jgi:hypothetical protein